MFKNFFKIAVRNILRQKVYAFINIFGLALGIACCILILLFIRYELSYDKQNKNAGRIYRVTREWFNQDGSSNLHLASVASPIGPLLKNDFPDIVLEEVRFLHDYDTYLQIKDNTVIEHKFYWVEPSAFKIFTIPFLKGDPNTALNEPNCLVITESAAKKYFGNENPLGKTLNYEKERELKITGVIKDVPENSHFKYDFLASFSTLYDPSLIGRKDLEEDWGGNNYFTYLLLPKNFPINELKTKAPAFLDNHLIQMAKAQNIQLPPKAPHFFTKLHFQKLTDIHLHSHLTSEIEENGDIKNVYIFSAIALFVLLIACINFMNLATARSSKRSKEIGIRKVLGAYRHQLMKQFIGESMITAFISLLFSILFVELALKPFSSFAGRNLKFNLISDPVLLVGIILLAVVVGFISGSYPSLFLSSFKPTAVFKGNKIASRKSVFRTALVILQFTISITLIIAMGTVFSQMQYVKNKDLGYNKDHLIILPSSGKIKNNLTSFKNQLLQNPQIKMVTSSRLVPSDMLLNAGRGQIIENDKVVPLTFRLADQETDYDFFKTYQVEFSAGRDFSKEYATDDSAAFILNESAARQLGWSAQEAVNKIMYYGGKKGRIIGVVQDFNFESLHNRIVPVIFRITHDGNNQVTVRISGKDVPGALKFLKEKWAEYRPGYPFDYTFLDDQIAGLYSKDQKAGDVFGIFAFIAIIIACLGLFGLAAYTAEVRTKEIGIRKVLGAKIFGIVILISKEFLLLILFANIIAWPLSFYFMNKWLDEFAYKSGISPWIFITSGAAAAIIALLTVSFQSIKAATANPVKSLRYE